MKLHEMEEMLMKVSVINMCELDDDDDDAQEEYSKMYDKTKSFINRFLPLFLNRGIDVEHKEKVFKINLAYNTNIDGYGDIEVRVDKSDIEWNHFNVWAKKSGYEITNLNCVDLKEQFDSKDIVFVVNKNGDIDCVDRTEDGNQILKNVITKKDLCDKI